MNLNVHFVHIQIQNLILLLIFNVATMVKKPLFSAMVSLPFVICMMSPLSYPYNFNSPPPLPHPDCSLKHCTPYFSIPLICNNCVPYYLSPIASPYFLKPLRLLAEKIVSVINFGGKHLLYSVPAHFKFCYFTAKKGQNIPHFPNNWDKCSC